MSTRCRIAAPCSGFSCRVITRKRKRFRRLPPASEAAATAAAKSKAPDLTGQGTILLVEDEDGLRSLNARGLRSRGYTVIEAGNGVEALEAIEREEGAVDLVVSDVVMPGRADAADRDAQAQPGPADHLRVRIC